MKLIKNLSVVVLFLMMSATTFAQETVELIEIKGRIISSETQEKISKATITLAGTNHSTVSNLEGKFSLKIPKSDKSQQLIVQAIEHKDKTITLSKNLRKSLKIELQSEIINLDTATLIAYNNPKELVMRVLKNRKDNYLVDHTLMTAFYRETIKKRNKNASLAEAVVSIYKQPYSNSKQDEVKMLKSRKDTDYSKLDTIALKLQGGPFSTLFGDVIKYPEFILSPDAIEAYTFAFDNNSEINGGNVLVVNFKQKNEVITPLYEGKLYISPASLALVKASYSLQLSNTSAVNDRYVRSKPSDVRIKARNISYEVNYREKDGKWVYGYSKANLSFEVKKRRKLFKSIYTLSCEMAITDWETAAQKTWATDAQIDEYIIMADQNVGFGDPDFWGEYNVIEPEKSIESAIKKIQRKLVKDQKSSTGI